MATADIANPDTGADKLVRLWRAWEELTESGLWTFEVDSAELAWSDGLYRLYGMEPGTPPLDLRTTRDRWVEADRERFMAAALATLRSGTPFDAEFTRDDGRRLRVRGIAECDASGRVVRTLGLTTDVSARHTAERERAASEDRFRQLFFSSPDAIALTSAPEGRIVEVNPRLLELTGFSIDELLGRNMLELGVWASPDERDRFIAAVANSADVENFRTRLTLPVGKRDVLLSMNQVDIAGTPHFVAHLRDISQFARTETELAQSEERFAQAFDASPQAACIWRLRDTRVVAANAQFRTLTGLDRGELDAMAGRVDHWRDPALRERFIDGIRRGEAVDVDDMEFLLPDGRVLPVHLSARPMQVDGEPGAICFFEDLTRQREAEGKFTQAFNANPDAASIIRLSDGLILDVNDGWERMFGWRRGEVEGRSLDDFPVWESAAVQDDVVGRLERDGVLGQQFVQFRRRDGSLFPARVSGSVVNIAGDACAVTDVQDVTEQRRTLEVLRDSEAKFSTLFHASPVAVFMLRQDDLTVLERNQAAAALFRDNPELTIGERVDVARYLLDQDDRQALADAVRGGEPLAEREVRLRLGSGRMLPVVVSTTPVDFGSERALLVHLRDVSETRRIEEQLRQSQKMEAIGQLAGGVAHDFNNLLGGISGYAELIQLRRNDPAVVAEHGARIVETARRAADLTRQLLLFSRRGPLRLVPTDVHGVVRNALGLVERTIDRRVEVVKHLSAPRATVRGDQGQLENAVLNLCLNARDAMPDGGQLTVTTRLVELDPMFCTRHQATGVVPGTHLAVAIADTGVGIPEGLADTIFEPFFTTKGAGRGTGLGLAAVFGTVSAHSGAIDVESTPGAGSTFTVYLPLSAEDAALEQAPQRPLVLGEGHLLVVEDEEGLRTMVTEMLTRLGYTVTGARDGQAAVELYAEQHAAIDLVLLDMTMPRMNGREAFERLRAIDPDTRVLVMSGYSQGDDLEYLLEHGATGLLQKPFEMSALSARVAEALAP